MKKDRFPDIKIEIKAEGLAKKILGKPEASTPSVYGEEKPKGKNIPDIDSKGVNREMAEILQTSNKKPNYTGLVKAALTELKLQKATGDDPSADAAAAAARQQKIGDQGFAPTSSVDSPRTARNPLVGSTSAMDEGAPTETGTRRMGTTPLTPDTATGEGGPQTLFKPPELKPGDPGFTFDMAAGAKRSSNPAMIDSTPQPDDAGSGGRGPEGTKYVGNLQIPNNIASQGRDAIDEFVKRVMTPGSPEDGLENNMEKAPAPAGNPMRDVAAQAVAHFVAPTSLKPVTKMSTQELVKEAMFEIRKDKGQDYEFGDLLLDGLMAAGYKKGGSAVISNIDKLGAGINYLIDAADPEITAAKDAAKDAAKKAKIDKPSWLMDKIGREVDIIRTNTPEGQAPVSFKDKKTVIDAKAGGQALAAGANKAKDFTTNFINKFKLKGLNPFKPGKKTKLGILTAVIYGGLNYGDDLAKKVGIDKQTVNNVQQGVLGTLDFLNPLRDGSGFSSRLTSKQFDSDSAKILAAVDSTPKPTPVGVPPGVNMKNIQKAPMVGGAAGQMPKTTTMNRPANMGVNVQQPVVSGAGTMKTLEKTGKGLNKPKAVGAPKKTRATKRKGK